MLALAPKVKKRIMQYFCIFFPFIALTKGEADGRKGIIDRSPQEMKQNKYSVSNKKKKQVKKKKRKRNKQTKKKRKVNK